MQKENRLVFMAEIPDNTEEIGNKNKIENMCKIEDAKENCRWKLDLLDAEKKWDTKAILSIYKDFIENKKISNIELAKKMNMSQIDIVWKIPEWKEFLWEFFGAKKWIISFHWNRELHRLVWLWEITPDHIQYLKVNWAIVKRVNWLRDYFEDKRWRYIKIVENTNVETNISDEEKTKIDKFPSDWKNIKAEQLEHLEKNNPELAKQIKEWKSNIPKELFYDLLWEQWKLKWIELTQEQKIQNKIWKDTIEKTKEKASNGGIFTPEQFIFELIDTFIIEIEKTDEKEISKDKKWIIISQINELRDYIKWVKDHNYLVKIKWWLEDWKLSPFTFRKENFEKMEKVLKEKNDLFNPEQANISEDKKEFLRVIYPIALQVEALYNVPWQVCMWQTILETWYWKSVVWWNYFWIKYTKYSNTKYNPWETHKTTEYISWKRTPIDDKFEKHSSTEESFMRYWEFLNRNNIYRNAFNYKDNPARFLAEIWNNWEWYATDPEYVEKIKSIWARCNIKV